MISFGVLCLAACALAQPAVYVSRTALDYPHAYYYPVDPMYAIVPEKEGAEKVEEVVISDVPVAPELVPLPLMKSIVIEPSEDEFKLEEIKKEEEPKEEIVKEAEEMPEDEKKEEIKEEPKEEVKEDEIHKEEVLVKTSHPVVMRISPPQFVTDFIGSLPQISLPQLSLPQLSLPQFNLPFFGSIFNKPKLEPVPIPVPGETPMEMVRYGVKYVPIVKK